ncbi:MAG: WbuC family cupin fold metalloprotein [Elusimicrobia bacterium]|nr:WbuC family cupin fold metalloprotein [Elusimicrobiota bacterium]
MIRLKTQNPDVFTADEPIVQFSQDEVGYLKELAPRSARKRVRICAHKDSGLPLNEMLLLFARGTYIRPSKHIGKEESLHVVDGRGLYVFFDEKGRMSKAIPGGPRVGTGVLRAHAPGGLSQPARRVRFPGAP